MVMASSLGQWIMTALVALQNSLAEPWKGLSHDRHHTTRQGNWGRDEMNWLLRLFGYYKIDYGYSCGRHWIEIDGKVIAQTPFDDVWLRDEDVHRLGYVVLDKGKYWTNLREY